MTGGGQVDPYAELGVSRDASSEEIRRAYRQVARRHHPDVNGNPGGPERFAAAARAYEILSDPAARARYDNRFPRPVPIRQSLRRPIPEAVFAARCGGSLMLGPWRSMPVIAWTAKRPPAPPMW